MKINNIFLLLSLSVISNAKQIEIRMPNVSTQMEDAYMASSFKLSDTQRYIISIEPLTNASVAHHMFVYGCEEPTELTKSFWEGANVCRGAKMLLFAWGLNAKALVLPEGIFFKKFVCKKIFFSIFFF